MAIGWPVSLRVGENPHFLENLWSLGGPMLGAREVESNMFLVPPMFASAQCTSTLSD